MASAPLLELKGVSVEFPGVKALQQVDFTLHSGEVVTLLGENGAGKSRLTGVYRRSAGEILLAGPAPVSFGLVSHRKMNARARHILAQYGLAVDVSQLLANYSIAIQQIVAIARAVDLSAQVLIFDDPTASLDANEVAMLLAILRQLCDGGVGMIFVTHFLDQVYQISDRITVLRNGQLVGTRDAATLPRLELVQMMLGKMFNQADLKRSDRPGDPRESPGGFPPVRSARHGGTL